MLLSLVLIGFLLIILGAIKQIWKIRIGYQLINTPGYVIIGIGLLIIIMGLVWL